MAGIEQLTIGLPTETAALSRRAVADGDDASTSEVVRAALRDWMTQCAVQVQDLAALKADLDEGLSDLDSGRVEDFDVARIVERG